MGKYLNKLKIGRGPGEITRIMSFAINENSKLIYAIDNSIKICVYNYDLHNINNYLIKTFASSDIAILNDENVLLLRNYVGKSEKYFIGSYNFSEKKIYEKYIHSDLSPYPMNTVITYNNFIQNDGKLYFYSPNIFGIFQYLNSKFTKIATLDLGEKSIPKSFYQNYINESPCKMGKEAKKKHYIPYILYSFPFNEFFFVITDDDTRNCYSINLKNNEVFNNGTLPNYFNLPDIPSLRIPLGIQDDKIIFSCIPSDFFKKGGNETIKEIRIAEQNIEVKLDDNPLLIIVN
jgi:hypothetical protein